MERGALIAGRYELSELLGRGGMGEVWAGRDRELHRSVAVKLLYRDDNASPELIQRFEREAVAAAQINHPNIVALYDRGTHGHLQFLVMEHVEGTSLAQYLHRQGPLNLARALEITQEICAALVAAHQANVVHYDIKPSNVMLTASGSIKVVDFGIAGFTHTHTFTVAPTTALSPAGTVEYGAPEQFSAELGDARSDLYALGSVLFALLTGRPPFIGGNPLAIVRLKTDDAAPPLDTLRSGLPPAVVRIVADLLQRDPDRRPQTAAEVHERLSHLLLLGDRDVSDLNTATATPLRATPTLREVQVTDGGRFEISWTGREPVTAYAPLNGMNVPMLWLSTAGLAAVSASLLYFTAAAGQMPEEGVDKSDSPWMLAFVPGSLAGVLALLCLLLALVHTWHAVNDARVHRKRSRWSLSVDSDGITTRVPPHSHLGTDRGSITH